MSLLEEAVNKGYDEPRPCAHCGRESGFTSDCEIAGTGARFRALPDLIGRKHLFGECPATREFLGRLIRAALGGLAAEAEHDDLNHTNHVFAFAKHLATWYLVQVEEWAVSAAWCASPAPDVACVSRAAVAYVLEHYASKLPVREPQCFRGPHPRDEDEPSRRLLDVADECRRGARKRASTGARPLAPRRASTGAERLPRPRYRAPRWVAPAEPPAPDTWAAALRLDRPLGSDADDSSDEDFWPVCAHCGKDEVTPRGRGAWSCGACGRRSTKQDLQDFQDTYIKDRWCFLPREFYSGSSCSSSDGETDDDERGARAEIVV